jgi:hypothetical protein
MKFEIQNSAQMGHLLEQLRSVAVLTSRLPSPVFQASYGQFRFIEFDITIGDQFWPVLWHLMRSSGDEHVNLTVLDPDPINYFFSNFHRYGALRFNVEDSSDDYYDALSNAPEESSSDALLYNSEVIVWLPDSLKWVIWGERSLGLAVIAICEDWKMSVSSLLDDAGLTALSLDRALLDLVSPNINKIEALDRFSRSFEKEYWVRGSGSQANRGFRDSHQNE